MEEPKAGLVLEKMVHSANVWVKEIMYELNVLDADTAYHLLRAILQALRDRLPPDEAVHLGANLPTLVRGIYFEGWKMSGKPLKLRSREAFYAHVEEIHNSTLPVSAEEAVRAVFKLLRHHIPDGEIEKIEAIMPEDLQELWPQKNG